MASEVSQAPDASALVDLRRRGQFLLGTLLWAAVAGFVIVASGYALIVYHYAVALAERLRTALGYGAPASGPDWFVLGVLACGPVVLVAAIVILLRWYGRVWNRRVAVVWPERQQRRRFAGWRAVPLRTSEESEAAHGEYLNALLKSQAWSRDVKTHEALDVRAKAEWILAELDQDIAERALATGLTVGISHNRYVDLFTIFAAAMELQLHVLSRLGKRPSVHAWRLLMQRCGASLFVNSYLNRQDSLALNLTIKKAGMGLTAAGDAMENAAQHFSVSDFDLDEALNMQHGGLLGVATKGLELGATTAFTVGQVGLHVLGTLIESVGDELTEGALAAGILYYHGIALAADTLAADAAHRQSVAMNRSFREGVWKMGEIAGSLLRDLVRQRRSAFRDRRKQIVRSLPKSAYARIQSLFGRKSDSPENVKLSTT